MGYVGTAQGTSNTMPYTQPIYQKTEAAASNPIAGSRINKMEVIVPTGVFGGAILQITDPSSGQPFQVTVPAGLYPGMRFEVVISNVPSTPITYQAPRHYNQGRRQSIAKVEIYSKQSNTICTCMTVSVFIFIVLIVVFTFSGSTR